MITLNNVLTADRYTPGCTLGPVPETKQLNYLIANASVYAQLAEDNPNKTQADWGDELLLTPQTGAFQFATGIRFRSALLGTPARVVAQLIQPADPLPIGGTPFLGSLSSGGAVSPGKSLIQGLTGTINGATGAILNGTGFTCARTGVGRYTLTWGPPSPFSSSPVVVASIVAATGNEVITINFPTVALCQINTNDAGAPADRSFDFIAIEVQ